MRYYLEPGGAGLAGVSEQVCACAYRAQARERVHYKRNDPHEHEFLASRPTPFPETSP